MARRPATLDQWDKRDDQPPSPQESQADAAYRLIKQAILDGGLAPGAQASEQQIAIRLGMSRTPTHQAIVRLEHEHWLELSPRRGLLIATIDAHDMTEIYEILMALEGAAAAKLASRKRDRHDAVDAALHAANAECVAALAAEDLRAWAEADHRFHSLLLDTCGNRRLAQLSQSVTEQAHRARLLTVRLRPRPTESNDGHEAIIAAIVARRPAGARRALETHRRRGIDTLVPILHAMTPPPSLFAPR